MSRKIFTYFQWGVETNLAKIQNHNTVQGYNSEENPFKTKFCFFAFDGFWSGLRLLTVIQQHVAGLGSHWATGGMLCRAV